MRRTTCLTAMVLLAWLPGCSNHSSAPATPPAPAAVASAAPAAETPAPAATTAPTAAAAEDSKLERAAPLPAAGKLPAGKWIAGTNYRVLVPAQPTDSPPGKVEVVEVFWFACPHCYAFDPFLESWRKTKPAYVDFKRVPVTWQDVHRAHARLFYTLEALGKEAALHNDVFAEMHDRKNYLYVQGDEAGTLAAEMAFCKAHGISAADFTSAYNSFSVQTNLTKADDLVHRYKVDSVPMMVINGKYVTDAEMAGSEANLISIIDALAASEKSL